MFEPTTIDPMRTYLILLRGINVGGKNKIAMADLKKCLTDHGYHNVTTYIASGNVVLQSYDSAEKIKQDIEALLPQSFSFDSELIKVLVLTQAELQAIIDHKPPGFADQPQKFHSDVIFLIDIDLPSALAVFDPKAGVDTIWPGENVIYSQRLSELRTKSRLSKIIGTKAYQLMTIRTWNTTLKLLDLLKTVEQTSVMP